MRRLFWTIAVLVSAAIAAWYARWAQERKPGPQARLEQPVEPAAEQPVEPPLIELPVERPERLQLKRIAVDPAVEAQLPEPCPLIAVEYRLGALVTNVLVDRFDDDSTSRNVVVGRRRIQVNTDGAPNSYHSRVIKADDETVGAINTICNAGVRIFKKAGDAKNPLTCRQNDYSVADEFAAAYEELRSKNWDDTESGYSIQFDWNILGKGAQVRPNGPYAPCVKDNGFFVAKTRLRLGRPTDDCDASIYPDSNATSAFVLPVNWFATYQKKSDATPARFSNFRSGDVVVAYRPGATNRQPVWAYGVIGDAGPYERLGEGTVAFNRQLQRSSAEIKTYRAALRLDTDVLSPKETGFIVFEGSARELKRDYSAANIKRAGERRFAAWMNGALDKAQSRFLACAKKLELLPAPPPAPPS